MISLKIQYILIDGDGGDNQLTRMPYFFLSYVKYTCRRSREGFSNANTAAKAAIEHGEVATTTGLWIDRNIWRKIVGYCTRGM